MCCAGSLGGVWGRARRIGGGRRQRQRKFHYFDVNNLTHACACFFGHRRAFDLVGMNRTEGGAVICGRRSEECLHFRWLTLSVACGFGCPQSFMRGLGVSHNLLMSSSLKIAAKTVPVLALSGLQKRRPGCKLSTWCSG